MDPKRLPKKIYSFLKSDVSDINTASLVIGALFAIVVSAAIGPMITGGVAHTLNNHNLPPYQSPSVDFRMESGDGKYTINGEDLEEFDGAEYNESTKIYEITIHNPGDRPIHNLDMSMPLPGCVIDYSTSGVGTEASVINYVELDLRGQSEGLREYSCSKTISIEQLDPKDHVTIRFLLRVSFNRCDLLQGVSTSNILTFNYQWQKNGIQFSESGHASTGFKNEYRDTFSSIRDNSVGGKTVRVRGVVYSNHIVGVDESNLMRAMGNCRLSNEDQE